MASEYRIIQEADGSFSLADVHTNGEDSISVVEINKPFIHWGSIDALCGFLGSLVDALDKPPLVLPAPPKRADM